MTIANDQVLKAARAFLAQMRLEWTKQNPDGENCPIKNIEDYSIASRVALLKSIQRALTVAV